MVVTFNVIIFLFKSQLNVHIFLQMIFLLYIYIDVPKPGVFDLSCLNVNVSITKKSLPGNCNHFFEYFKTWFQNLYFVVLFTYIGESPLQMYVKVYAQIKNRNVLPKGFGFTIKNKTIKLSFHVTALSSIWIWRKCFHSIERMMAEIKTILTCLLCLHI